MRDVRCSDGTFVCTFFVADRIVYAYSESTMTHPPRTSRPTVLAPLAALVSDDARPLAAHPGNLHDSHALSDGDATAVIGVCLGDDVAELRRASDPSADLVDAVLAQLDDVDLYRRAEILSQALERVREMVTDELESWDRPAWDRPDDRPPCSELGCALREHSGFHVATGGRAFE